LKDVRKRKYDGKRNYKKITTTKPKTKRSKDRVNASDLNGYPTE